MGKVWEFINIVRSLPALYLYRRLPCATEIREDLIRFGFEGSRWGLHRAMLYNFLFRKVFYYRTNQCAPRLTRLSKLFYRPFGAMELDAEHIGGGFAVYHGYSTIVFAKSIGKNFTVYQQVTIGRGRSFDGNDIPIIGDHVTVCAGAIIVGGVRIGNNVTIGAGAVVVRDVPDNTTVVGAPMRVIMKQGDGNE